MSFFNKVFNKFAAVVNFLLANSWFFVLVYLLLSLYTNGFLYCWSGLIAPVVFKVGFTLTNHADMPQGIGLLAASVFLKLVWFSAWIQTLLITWFCDRKWKPPKHAMSIMQSGIRPEDHETMPFYEDHRPRTCPRGCDFSPSDRVYHCSRFKRCLPLYDHYCEFLKVTVYLRTMKPYLFCIGFLFLDSLFTLGVTVAGLTSGHVAFTWPSSSALVLTALMVGLVSGYNYQYQLLLLAWRNDLNSERSIRDGNGSFDPWVIAFKYKSPGANGEWRLHNRRLAKNPWDLGGPANLRQVFGQHWWQWFLFWVPPERVSKYGDFESRCGYSDLPMSKLVESHRRNVLNNVPRDAGTDASASHAQGSDRRSLVHHARRSQQHSSGASATQAEASGRQRRLRGTDV
ncbi:hypothetical protein F4780DRAFT_784007 [Xylariomycetidae sp. FL0641]|nr:hypothetical protein F4780DRAFT_784007 [Xylariomycetidae sp. FL0641]